MTNEKVRRPLGMIEPVAQQLLKELRPSCERIEIAGSIRRRSPFVGDIELVAIPAVEKEKTADPHDIFGQIVEVPHNRLWERLDVMVGSEKKFIVYGPRYRAFMYPFGEKDLVKVDVFTAVPETWGLIYLMRTGSADFSHYVIGKCLRENGYLSHDGWVRRVPEGSPAYRDWKDKEKDAMPKYPTPTEEDVFRLAGLSYRNPNQRGG